MARRLAQSLNFLLFIFFYSLEIDLRVFQEEYFHY